MQRVLTAIHVIRIVASDGLDGNESDFEKPAGAGIDPQHAAFALNDIDVAVRSEGHLHRIIESGGEGLFDERGGGCGRSKGEGWKGGSEDHVVRGK